MTEAVGITVASFRSSEYMSILIEGSIFISFIHATMDRDTHHSRHMHQETWHNTLSGGRLSPRPKYQGEHTPGKTEALGANVSRSYNGPGNRRRGERD